MHLSHLNSSCSRWFFSIVYSELRTPADPADSHTVAVPRDPETSACSYFISCPLLDPGTPSLPWQLPEAPWSVQILPLLEGLQDMCLLQSCLSQL